MDSCTVRRTLSKLPDQATVPEIDDALAWLVEQQRQLLSKWDSEAYRWSCIAIDDLLDARLGLMGQP